MIRSASSSFVSTAAGARGALAVLDLQVVLPEESVQLADVADLRAPRVGALDALRVGHHLEHDAPDLVRLGEDRDGVSGRLAHLAHPVGAEHHRRIGEDRLRLGEDRPVAAVEGAHDLARQLEVGGLVLPDRHPAGLVDDDVRGLQDRVVEQPHAVVDPLVLLLLVGRRALHPAHRHDRVEDPGQLGMLRHVGLADQGAALRIEPHRQQVEDHLVRQLAHLLAVVDRGHGVVIDDRVDRVVPVLERDVVDLRAEVVAQVRGPRTAGFR